MEECWCPILEDHTRNLDAAAMPLPQAGSVSASRMAQPRLTPVGGQRLGHFDARIDVCAGGRKGEIAAAVMPQQDQRLVNDVAALFVKVFRRPLAVHEQPRPDVGSAFQIKPLPDQAERQVEPRAVRGAGAFARQVVHHRFERAAMVPKCSGTATISVAGDEGRNTVSQPGSRSSITNPVSWQKMRSKQARGLTRCRAAGLRANQFWYIMFTRLRVWESRS